MTFTDFKDELYLVRENRRSIKSLIESIDNLTAKLCERLSGGVQDYSKDRLQKTPDPDAKVIETIAAIEEERTNNLDKLNRLREANIKYEAIIMAFDTLGGEILRLYFIEGLSIKSIGKRIDYSEQYTWELWRKAMRDLYEKENSNE
jgi:DNA-directed RNA polymerase specialized sigma subunit